MIIRPAGDADVDTMMDIRVAVRENEMTLEELAERGITTESLRRMMQSTHVGFCAEDNDHVLGFSMADTTDASIFALFVSPEHERRDIGSKLLAIAVAHLVSLGNDRLTLETEPDTRAYDFYIKKGWKYVGPTAHEDVVLEYVVEK